MEGRVDTQGDILLPEASLNEGRRAGVIDVGSLRIGMRLAQDIYDSSGILLLAAGTTISPDFIELLRRRSIRWVKTQPIPTPAPTEPAADIAAVIKTLDRQLELPQANLLAVRPLEPAQRPRIPLGQLRVRADIGLKRHATAEGTMRDLCSELQRGAQIRDVKLHGIVQSFADMVALDLDLLPTILSLQTTPDEFIFNHSVNVAGMSIAMAAQLGLSNAQIMEIGLGALLQDIGMLRVPESIRMAPRVLTAEEMAEIHRHPEYTLDFLEKIPTLSGVIKLVGYQHHERLDKSGYPRKRAGMLIHPYAKIVGIADAYMAMTCPRPYREPMLPYEAARIVLYDCASRKFDNTFVRAFLDCISLFPIGSYVELDDGQTAKVLRANPNFHTKPVVEMVDSTEYGDANIVDLSKEHELRIVRPTAEPLL